RAIEDVREGDRLPESIAGFRIIRELGRGGMGVVCEAEEDEPRRRVALKVLPILAPSSLARRLRQEAHLLAQLDHPGIARVYQAGVTSVHRQRTPFIAMELVEGGPVDRFVREHQVPVRERLRLVAMMADAVHAAHLRGIIHRDLKPANVLIAVGDGEPQPRILDFGVARLLDRDLAVTAVKTETSQLVGTLQYMSPEQLSGDPGLVDARTDVYALGVIAYELLIGESPFRISDRPLADVIDEIRSGRVASVRSRDPELRTDASIIIGTAMARDVKRRYQSAAELAADIRRHLDGRPILAHPPSAAYQVRMFVRRNAVAVGGAVAAFASLLLGLVVSVIFARH
ncbi:MAG: serine/threonine protein kinase, partial [Phycisphaerales bacterium]|nr:serine/threonine protein kinase [Phycisphaerales bacterium]